MSKAISSIDLIAAFESVMVTGSLSAAARQLTRSQPTVRRQIESLEAELGVVLFTRSGNRLDPTELAASLLPQAQSIVSGVHVFNRTAITEAKALTGRVRLSCSRVFANFLMPDVIKTLVVAYPDLCVELAPEDRVVNLLQREADIGIRFSAPDQNALVVKKLLPRQLGLFAATGLKSPVSDDAPITDHLNATPFVWEDRDDMLGRGARQSKLSVPTNIAMRTDDQTAQIACIQAGVGAGFCQIKIANKLGLRRLAPDWRFAAPIWVAMHEDLSKISRVRVVFDAMAQAFLAE
ncbi:LysR family transcriptional regulator [Gymnodinialimonas hymeniacidonis]|uniref:LysR family transcriptional regulator n=1 Tax=Gymnodinialimonas hymeniacidonis TaxID=3126508 RepID=UPI0034C5BAAE